MKDVTDPHEIEQMKDDSSKCTCEPPKEHKAEIELGGSNAFSQQMSKDSTAEEIALGIYPVEEMGLITGWEDVNKELREGFIEGFEYALQHNRELSEEEADALFGRGSRAVYKEGYAIIKKPEK